MYVIRKARAKNYVIITVIIIKVIVQNTRAVLVTPNGNELEKVESTVC